MPPFDQREAGFQQRAGGVPLFNQIADRLSCKKACGPAFVARDPFQFQLQVLVDTGRERGCGRGSSKVAVRPCTMYAPGQDVQISPRSRALMAAWVWLWTSSFR